MTSEKTRKRELDALAEAAEELHCDNLFVITNDQQEQINWKTKNRNIDYPNSQTINIYDKLNQKNAAFMKIPNRSAKL